MLFPVAGSQLYIYSGGAFRLIAEVESIGSLGFHSELIDLSSTRDDGRPEFIKGNMTMGAMQIVLGIVPGDLGQGALWDAAASDLAASFRLDFAGGAGRREWEALVVGISETLEEANSAARLLVDLQIVSEIERQAGSP